MIILSFACMCSNYEDIIVDSYLIMIWPDFMDMYMPLFHSTVLESICL